MYRERLQSSNDATLSANLSLMAEQRVAGEMTPGFSSLARLNYNARVQAGTVTLSYGLSDTGLAVPTVTYRYRSI